MKNLCIIPARGGSKRIPRKNIKDFFGKPIIAYSIEAAIKSNLFDEIMVSTDDNEICEISKQYGANVPFMRSALTSNDYASTSDVILEVLKCYNDIGKRYDNVACIYPTAPFITENILLKAFSMLNKEIDSVFTMVAYSYPIQRGLHIIDGKVKMINEEFRLTRSQDLEKIYHDAGQFYISKIETYLKEKTFWGENTAGIELSELEVQDLDTLTDWKLAEMKYELLQMLK
ncbi:MAG: pseudaminic acid cytidylyltransferase [Endomicrobium sp.]|jgi:N-acylneuraminate cytidylyltransferase|nr:pseudaminic acid cytidylyltransferase [Endomicrobium sp.]